MEFFDRTRYSLILLLILVQQTAADSHGATQNKTRAIFNRELSKLLSNSNPETKKEILKHYGKHADTSRQYLYIGNRSQLSNVPPKIRSRVQNLETHYAKKLESQIEICLLDGEFAQAFRLVHEIAYHHPTHEIAQTVINQSSRKDSIHARLSRASHRQIGWPKGKYWRVSSPHFQIATNATQQQGEQLAILLENLVTAWRQVFFEYASSGQNLKRAIEHKTRLTFPRRSHRIVLFATRQDYVNFLSKMEPFAQETLGYYSSKNQTAYFFLDDRESLQATWLHETTHQLFHETRRVRKDIGRDHNFWVVEGLALYMESLQELHDGCWSVGGLDADRIQFARHRRIAEGFFVPLQTLSSFGQQQIQQHKDIRRLYSQAAGITQFFLHQDNGSLRKPFMRYLSAVYAGRDSESTLAAQLKVPLADLDVNYARFLQVGHQELKALDPRVRPRNLSLRNMKIRDGCFDEIDMSELTWLDVSQTKISDEGIKPIAAARHLRQVSFENTNIGDKTVNRLSAAKGLLELDLSGTQITDASCETLKSLSNLTSLWLDRTKVSSQKEKELRSVLKNLVD